jgi:MFS family permease
MAGEMALILEAVEGRRGEGVRERAFRIFWWIVGLGGVGITLGTICGLWVAGGAWRWLVGGVGLSLLGGLGYLAWRG